MVGLCCSDSQSVVLAKCVGDVRDGIEEGTVFLLVCCPAGPWVGTLAQGSLLAGGQRDVAERPGPSPEARALEGGPGLDAVGVTWTGLLGAEVYQSLRVRREHEAGQSIRFPDREMVLCQPRLLQIPYL